MNIRHLISYIVIFVFLLFLFAPIALSVVGSVMPETELRSPPGSKMWFVRGPTTVYYQYVFLAPLGIEFPSQDPYLRYEIRSLVILNIAYFGRILLNSVIVATTVAVTNFLLASLAAFGFTRLNFRGKTGLFTFVLVSRLLPPVVLAVPYYVLMQVLGLVNNLASIILVHIALTLPFSIWYLVLYYRTIPVEIEEASRVDGATLWQTIRYITMPVAGTGLIAIALFSFLTSYNEFLFAHFLLGRIDVQTVPVFVASMATATDVYWAMMYSIIVLTILPMIVAVLFIVRLVNISQLAGAIKF
jgi:ABC-type glycerol-3-phosphate transport system permease component